jgi:16S rRNA (guanine527-N7)-methyltransferase
MELLQAGAREWVLELTSEQVEAFELYYRQLLAWNQRINLTTITGYEEVQLKHFLDSLSCLQVLDNVPADVKCIDIGAGAGFPGLPLKIVRPQMRVTLLESTGKKTLFLEHLVQELALGGVDVVKVRAEELGRHPDHREASHVALARAVARLPVLVEYALPLVEVGGVFVAQKGDEVKDEVEAASTAIELLGGRLREVITVALPRSDVARHLVVIEKATPTPERYPRRPGMPAKRPLLGNLAGPA